LTTAKKVGVVINDPGPAGLLLDHSLRAEEINCDIFERQTCAYVESRTRAGVLESGTVGLMRRLGIDACLKTEGTIGRDFNSPL
jgi:p-hydroxybenzoate 3-monooxygenase